MSDDDNEAQAIRRVGKDLCVKDPEVLKFVDNYDRPGKAFTAGTYAGTGDFGEGFENKPGKRIPKPGAYAAAGAGYARAEWRVCAAEAKGPNASAGVGISMGSGARAFAKAELASASASAGVAKIAVGLAVDTGVAIGPSGIEAKILGTGFTIGSTVGISVLGNSLEFTLW